MRIIEKLRALFGESEAERRSRDGLMATFRAKYSNFQTLLASNTELLGIIADIEQKLAGKTPFGPSYIDALSLRSIFHTTRMVRCLEEMSGRTYPALQEKLVEIFGRIKSDAAALEAKSKTDRPLVLPYATIRRGMVDLVGAKNANLGEIRNALNIPTPRGFAITTEAFRHFIEANHLAAAIRRMKSKADLIETQTIIEVSQAIQTQILAVDVPGKLGQAILDAHGQLMQELGSGGSPVNVSLRSSALGEDSTLSFAGQYLTVLNVPPQRILEDYRRIIASLFSSHAIAYRLHLAITFEEAVMAVACQEMIDAQASGVMFTRNPVVPLEDHILINAVWGLGPFAVEGIVPPDTYTLSREPVPRMLSATAVPKEKQLLADGSGHLVETRVPDEDRLRRCLNDDQARQLAEYGMRLEAYFGTPQDVEWALDRNGRLVILQARPLRVHEADIGLHRQMTAPIAGHRLLLEGGETACAGIGCGPVVLVRGQSDVTDFPDGGVLVSPLASFQLVMAMPKARAIVTDTGNLSGHMALLAREYMIPTILNLKNAAATLTPEMVVTVDAFHGRVYAGRVQELIDAEHKLTRFIVDTPTHQDLRRRADAILPLNLKDPKSPTFAPAHCRTIHDIMRFAHEKAYEEIFQLGDLVTDRGRLSVRLEASLPLDLYVIDMGGGLTVDATRVSRVTPDQVLSVPFAALLEGMLDDALVCREPRPVSLGGFLSVMSRQMLDPPNLAAERFGDRSYAIISDRYMNFSSRVGYHYGVLDSYCGKTEAKNYINFQFKGGAADEVRRNRRARVIESVLSTSGFHVNTVGDRVTARIAKQSAAILAEKLERVGRLLIFTRQMDMLMHSETLVADMAQAFLSGNYHLREGDGCRADGER